MPSKVRILYTPGLGMQYTGSKVLEALQHFGATRATASLAKFHAEHAKLPYWKKCLAAQVFFKSAGRLLVWRERRGVRRCESQYLQMRQPKAKRLGLRIPRRAAGLRPAAPAEAPPRFGIFR